MDNHSMPNIAKLFDCNDINSNRDHTSQLLHTDPIGPRHPAAPMATGERTLSFETATSRGSTFRTLIGGLNEWMWYGYLEFSSSRPEHIPRHSVNIYLYLYNYDYDEAEFPSPYGDMERTLKYEWIYWMCPTRCMWYQTTSVSGPNLVMVDRSLCRFYIQTIRFSSSVLYGPPKTTLICRCSLSAETCVWGEKSYRDNCGEDSPSPRASLNILDCWRTYLSRGYELSERMMTASETEVIMAFT